MPIVIYVSLFPDQKTSAIRTAKTAWLLDTLDPVIQSYGLNSRWIVAFSFDEHFLSNISQRHYAIDTAALPRILARDLESTSLEYVGCRRTVNASTTRPAFGTVP